ncbi:hypothetical protein [Vibrio salinus]|uniref:hypothetical protein n=1 Tax=Vibrio salinus TaxID=2899784 RepID=UPI001E3FB40B|nr:hypothetical protein [Vibrio salinus]MCE0496127.1 hypothetical protein [Vibrio salinus]
MGGSGIIITFVWKQLAFSTLLISGAMAALDDTTNTCCTELRGFPGSYSISNYSSSDCSDTGCHTRVIRRYYDVNSALSVPLMIGTGSPTMMTADIAFRINSYGDYHVANSLGIISYLICAVFAWFYLRHSLKEKGASS